VNITHTERLGRVAAGLAAIMAGIVLLASAGSVLAVVLEALLIAAGLDVAVTGALGHCPLYQKLGHVPPIPAEHPMTTRNDPCTQVHDPTRGRDQQDQQGHGGHGWMMIACCIPMLAIAGILVATGAASPGFLAIAVGCTLMMALMMRGMTYGGGGSS